MKQICNWNFQKRAIKFGHAAGKNAAVIFALDRKQIAAERLKCDRPNLIRNCEGWITNTFSIVENTSLDVF